MITSRPLDLVRNEARAALVLLVSFAVLATLYWGKQGSLIVDTGRELYLPWEVLRGKVLLREIFINYGPLSYQINALFYGLFGVHTTVLNAVGLATAFLIVTAYYVLARQFLPRLVATPLTFAILSACVFRPGLFNFVLPYSFAATYGLLFALTAIYLSVRFARNRDVGFAVGSLVAAGSAVACKYEYALLATLLLVYTCVRTNTPMVMLRRSLLAFTAVPALSVIALIAQGMRLDDFAIYAETLNHNVESTATWKLYATLQGSFTYENTLDQIFLIAIAALLSYGAMVLLLGRKPLPLLSRPLPLLWRCAGALAILAGIPFGALGRMLYRQPFCFFPLSLSVIMLTVALLRFRAGLRKGRALERILLLAVATFCATIKTPLYMDLSSYGALTFPLLLLVHTTVLVRTVPPHFVYLHRRAWQAAFSLVLTVIGSCFVLRFSEQSMQRGDGKVISPRGSMAGPAGQAETLNQALAFVAARVPHDAILLVWPEGELLNFMSERASHPLLHCALPSCIEALGEPRMLAELRNHPPEFIALTNRQAREYGHGRFCESYGLELCNFVRENYMRKAQVGSSYVINFFERRDGVAEP